MNNWKTTWACAHRATWFTQWDQDSFSYTVKNNLYGSSIRLSYSNWYGEDDCYISKVLVEHNGKTAIIQKNGKNDFVIKAKEMSNIYSDAYDMNVVPGDIKFTVKFADKKRPQSGQTFMTPPGVVMIVQAIEVLCDEEPEIVAVLGDSIAHWGKWTGPVIEQLYKQKVGKIAFFEMAINGSRLLNGSPKQLRNSWGYCADWRVKHDIFCTSGVTTCIFALGLNDLCIEEAEDDHLLTLETYQEKVGKLCNWFRQKGIKIIGLTICPRVIDEIYTSERNELRKLINNWIMESGVFDKIVDVASVVKNGTDNALYPQYAWEDQCHINEYGGVQIAKKIMEELFL